MVILDPTRYPETPVSELLAASAAGWIGVDRRLVTAILDREPAAVADVLTFGRAERSQHRVIIDPMLLDLFRHWGATEALEFYVDVLTRTADDVDDDLICAMLPLGRSAVVPLLKLHEDLGEEMGGEVAFILAALRVKDPEVLQVLIDRLEFDLADGAFLLGLYGDPGAREPLEGMLAELPPYEEIEAPGEIALRRELERALEQLDAPESSYEVPELDRETLLREYPAEAGPVMEVLSETERIALLDSPDSVARIAAAHSFFNHEVHAEARQALLRVAQNDADAEARGRAWASLADATAPDPEAAGTKGHDQAAADRIRDLMIEVVLDGTREVAERGGAAVGLYGAADQRQARAAIEALYQEGGLARAKALETMWRSLYKPFAQFFPAHLEDTDKRIVRQALRGAGYFQLTPLVGVIESYFDRDDEMADLREDALFAYALAMPGEAKPKPARVKAMLRKIDQLADLDADETDLVMFALDERMQLAGLKPVFATEEDDEASTTDAAADAFLENATGTAPDASTGTGIKVGRNDPCPCGSGKKYKKCCGA